uniref:DUF1993 domain-containing protein n=1 Tax=uncultured bacterium UPO57 TaxID=1776980 RepID=A0A126SYJ0_9BACT|nr:hypothetical protein Mmar10_2170 [uncultured bacterium UPO57]
MSLTHSALAFAALQQMHAALDGILEKGAAYAKSKNIDEDVLINWRLAPDMFPMGRQVQIACDVPARGLARLAGAEPPNFSGDEKTFDELRARVAKAGDFIHDLDKAAIDADPDKEISIPLGSETLTLKRRAYLLNFILPNLYFHVTTCYANLRACGVPIGKADYLPGLR